MGISWNLVDPVVEAVSHEQMDSDGIRPLARAIAPPTGEAAANEYVAASISTYSFSADAMAQIGFSDLAKFRAETNVGFFVIEVAVYTATVIVQTTDHKRMQLARMGVGFRIGLAVWGVDVKASANVGLAAASTEIKSASTSLKIKQYGLTPDMVKIIEPLNKISKPGTDYMLTLTAVAQQLSDYIAKNGAAISPKPLQVAPLDVDAFQPVSAAASNRFAVERIRRWQPSATADQWIRDHQDRYDAVISSGTVAAAYRSFGITSADATPSNAEHDDANKMDYLGW